jgi:uncharacterized membrane protein YidH (DUF202 family)
MMSRRLQYDAVSEEAMAVRKTLGVLLIAGGVLALVYGGFSYTKKTHRLNVGVAELKYDERARVHVPIWAGIGAIAVGTAVLLVGRK